MMETMRKYLDEQGRKSEITSRLLEIKALEETPELRAERETLTKKQGEVEIAFRKALAEVRVEEEQTVTTFDTEELELRQLEQKASMGDIAAGVLTQHACEGASRELQQHHHLKPNQVPLSAAAVPGRGKAYLRDHTWTHQCGRGSAAYHSRCLSSVGRGLPWDHRAKRGRGRVGCRRDLHIRQSGRASRGSGSGAQHGSFRVRATRSGSASGFAVSSALKTPRGWLVSPMHFA